MRVRFMSQAEEEVLQATAYYVERSNEIADQFLAALSDATDLLLQFPSVGSPVEGEARRIILKTFHYQLVYRAYTPLPTSRGSPTTGPVACDDDWAEMDVEPAPPV